MARFFCFYYLECSKTVIVPTKFLLKYHHFLLFCLLSFGWHGAFTQINYEKFPKNNQVLQRNDQNEAVLAVKGTVTENNYSSVSLIILQDGNVFSQQTINLDASKNFDFSPKLRAGKYDYTVKLYLDGTREMKTVTKVAVGDIFLIYGQSNALGTGGIETYRPAENPLIRYFDTFNYNNGESEWFLPYTTFYWPGTGAMELMRFLCDKYQYPVGIIQASIGGSDIRGLNNRNDANPTDKNTYYGQMLLQTEFSDLRNQIKYIIFRHGESDGLLPLESQNYPAEFDKLYKNLVTDFPSLSKFYHVQTNILTQNNNKAGFLRDFQRRTKYLYPKIITMSCIGTVGYDGLHYTLGGYSQTAFELSRIIGREIYRDNSSEQVYSPDLKRAFWENNKLVLEFDEAMQMQYPEDLSVNGFVYQMKDYIYIDGKNDVVQSGVANGNKIYLTVANTENAKFVSYLPSWFGSNDKKYYDGVYLKNAMGMRAFSFDNVEIGGQAPVLPPVVIVPPIVVIPPVVVVPPVIVVPPTVVVPPTPTSNPLNLTLLAHEDIMVKLVWNGNSQTKYHVERSVENSTNFNDIGTINGDTYFDTQVKLDQTYYYRVYAEGAISTKSAAKIITLKCLDNVNLKTFPNISYVGANISIAAIVTISKAKQLSLQASKSIDLNHGFDAEAGSDFSAEIGGCKNN